jgi:hypothetical protein
MSRSPATTASSATRRRASRSVAVALGIGAIRGKAQRRLMQPRRDAIGCRPDLPILYDGAVECRLLGTAAEVDPRSDAARWRLVLYPAPALKAQRAKSPQYADNVSGRESRFSRCCSSFW